MNKRIAGGLALALGLGALPASAAPRSHNARVYSIADGGDPMQFAIDFAAAKGRNISEVDDSSGSEIDGAGPDSAQVSRDGGNWEVDDSSGSKIGEIEQDNGNWEIDDSSGSKIGEIEQDNGNWEIDDSSGSKIGEIEFGS